MQSEQGIGVRPARYSATKGRTTSRFEALLLVDHVVGNPQVLGDAASVIHIVKRAAASGLGRIGNAVLAGQASLVPKLQGQPHELDIGLARGEHRRDRRGVDPSGHGDGNGGSLGHGVHSSQFHRK